MGAQSKMQGQILKGYEGSNELNLPLLGVSESMLKGNPCGTCKFLQGNVEKLQFSDFS